MLANRVLELNASDERGLSIVRNKIKAFANLTVSTPSSSDKASHPCPPFKLIILDESDTMTTDAQAALRRIIEAHSKITRFVLICNYVTRIITPLASRCAKFRFKALERGRMKARLLEIVEGEGVGARMEPGDLHEVLDTIIETSGGDMRRAVTTLQSTVTFSQCPTPDDVYEMSGVVPNKAVSPLLEACQQGAAKTVSDAVKNIMCEGYPAQEVFKTLSRLVLADERLGDSNKADVSIAIGNATKNLVDGADEELQIVNVAMGVVRAFGEVKNRMQ
jgi:replication factor C subunit 2/4